MAAPDQPLTPEATGRPEPGPAVLQVRAAVKRLLQEAGTPGVVGVAVSGGADSLALADAAVHAPQTPEVHAVVVDHRLQAGSAATATAAAAAARGLGVTTARVIPVEVEGPGGPEASARRARYAALADALPGMPILLGHTLDDQAETVLLGLGRGSGPRSIAGMRPLDPPWARPLLGVPRAVTVQACAELGLQPWQDPHNADPAFTRVRLRTEVLPLLEDVLQGGVAAALARTAGQLREDLEALDVLAADLLEAARLVEPMRPSSNEVERTTHWVGTRWPVNLALERLEPAPAAIRRRVIRRWLLEAGTRDLSELHLRAVDDLVGQWRGQGGVWLPGDLVAARAHGRLHLNRAG